MTVKLIAVSKPSENVDAETAEQLVAYCARVSNPSNQASHGSAAKLIKYLVQNEHWSPLEMVSITMEIETDRTIARQILRHRSFSFQEFSQRYAEVPDFVEPYAPRLQDTKNRQNSLEIDDPELAGWWIGKQDVLVEQARVKYQWALEKGIAKEVARVVLPEGLTQSRLYMAGTLRSWIHYCQLRMGNGTQKEHTLIAEQCWNVLCEQFPAITDLFKVDPLEQAVEDFAVALLKRLRLRAEQGKSGWQEDDWEGDCLYKMYRSAEQGDALDTAGYALFAHHHGWGKTDAD